MFLFTFSIAAGKFGTGKIETLNKANEKIHFSYYFPDKFDSTKLTANVLVCVGGLNSDGSEFMINPWIDFSDKNNFIIVSPAFRFNQSDWDKKLSYQYPEIWSGDALLKMLEEINVKKYCGLYLFGFSAGAQFVHRFALLYPSITEAVYAHAAGDYSYPDKKIITQFMIGVGEYDNDKNLRLEKAKLFHKKCMDEDINCILKIYPKLGHSILYEQMNTALNFFIEVKNIKGD